MSVQLNLDSLINELSNLAVGPQTDDDKVNDLASVLFGEEEGVRFAGYSVKEKLEAVTLLQSMYETTQEDKYLELMYFVACYCPEAMAYVNEQAPFTSIRIVGEALIAWKKQTDCSSIDMAVRVDLFAKYDRKTASRILTELVIGKVDGRFITETLYHIVTKYKGNEASKEQLIKMSEQMCERMPKGFEYIVFIRALNAKTFPVKLRAKLINHYVSETAKPTSCRIAVAAARWLTFSNIQTLVQRMDDEVTSKGSSTLFREFMLNATHIDSDLESRTHDLFVEYPDLLDYFESEIRKDAQYPGISFFLDIVESRHFPQERKQALYKRFLADDAPSHLLLSAAQLLEPSEKAQIASVAKKLAARSTDCPYVEQYCELVHSRSIDSEVVTEIKRHALQAKSFTLITRLSSYFTLSEVWSMLSRIEQMPCNAETAPILANVLTCMQNAPWYPDARDSKPTWCANCGITDRSVHSGWKPLIIETCETLNSRFGVSPNQSVYDKLLNDVVRIDRDFPRAVPKFVRFWKKRRPVRQAPQPLVPVPPLNLALVNDKQ